MRVFLIRRLARAIIVLWGVTLISFGVLFLKGDPSYAMAGADWSRQDLENFRRAMGFDRPWHIQYLDFLGRAVQGDFGNSLSQHQPTFQLVMSRMPATLELAGASLLVAIVFGIPLGILSATRRNGIWDHLAMALALLAQAMPVFWLGVLLILVFGIAFPILPVAGRGGIENLILPAFALGAHSLARNARLIRSSLLEVLGQDYVRTARAKGLAERTVILRHGLRNAMIPVVTLIALDLGFLLGGSVITETIFAWPGVGRLTVAAIHARDVPLVQTAVTVLAVIFVLLNLVVDLVYTRLDPRIRMA
jgi:peptide/nickel transport system permease protein